MRLFYLIMPLPAVCLSGLLFAAGNQQPNIPSTADSTKRLGPLIERIFKKFRLPSRLSLNDLKVILATDAKQAENKQYWSFNVPAYGTDISVNTLRNDTKIISIKFSTDRLNQLNLADLEHMFGPHRLTIRSKTSWVGFPKFSFIAKSDLIVRAHLYHSPERKPCPVLSVTLYRPQLALSSQ